MAALLACALFAALPCAPLPGAGGAHALAAQGTPAGTQAAPSPDTAAPETRAPDGAPAAAPAGEPAPRQSSRDHGIKLFGTVEFQRPKPLTGWVDMLDRNAANPIFSPERQFNRSTTWKQLKERAAGKSPRAILRLVNSFWNDWPYREDLANWGKPDYWAVPAEFLKKSGDCEDYAITKYFTLKELGFPPEDMRIVVVHDTIRNLGHAVLVVYLDGEAYVLDNLGGAVQPHTQLRNYTPQYSVNENGRWTHMKGRPAATGRPGGKRK